MPVWVDVAPVASLDDNSCLSLDHGRRRALISQINGTQYAFEGLCTHADELLEFSRWDAPAIFCPHHGARFCTRTGRALTPPATRALRPLPLRIDDGILQVAFD